MSKTKIAKRKRQDDSPNRHERFNSIQEPTRRNASEDESSEDAVTTSEEKIGIKTPHKPKLHTEVVARRLFAEADTQAAPGEYSDCTLVIFVYIVSIIIVMILKESNVHSTQTSAASSPEAASSQKSAASSPATAASQTPTTPQTSAINEASR